MIDAFLHCNLKYWLEYNALVWNEHRRDDGPVKNNLERRSGLERRLISYVICIPERRSGQDNRINDRLMVSGEDDKIPTGNG